MLRLGVSAGADGSLARRLAWLTALRLVVLTVFLVVTTGRFGVNLGSFTGFFALITVGAAYLVAALYAAMLRRGRHLEAVAFAQLATDQLIWTAIVYISGGVWSGATSLYGLTSLSGAILLGVRGGVVAALSGAAAFLAMCGGFAFGSLHPPPDQPLEAFPRGLEMGYPIFVNLLALSVVTALASYLGERLRTTGGHLERATARAEEAERLAAALGRLSAGLAHEIRNPLGAIAASIELLRVGSSLSDEDKKLCEIIERETARVNDLVGDMLDLSRPRLPAKAPVDLGATVRDVSTLALRYGRGADVGVRCEAPALAMVFADSAQLRQVAWNLVRNAIQASSAGDEVLVRVLEGSTGYALEVIDGGPGIPPDARERLFDAFFTTRTGGVGIGLAVVKRIVDDHGFTIEVSDRAGGGTVFRVRIPRYDAAEVVLSDATTTPAPMSRRPRVSGAPFG